MTDHADAFEPDLPNPGQATSFGPAAALYEKGRPSYPAEVVDWLVPEGATHVVDLGAGTGKFTRLLVAKGLHVAAVEPSAGMRDELIRAVPGAQVLPGSAERLPIDGESVDAVLAAQSWHWVDPARAVPEVARVLRPGGTLGMVWNMRARDDGWLDELDVLLEKANGASVVESGDPTVGAPFGPVEKAEFAWVNRVPHDDVIAMVASRSYVITRPDDQRAAILGEVRELLETHPATRGRALVDIPYVAKASRTRLLPS
ncbi:class I SAM-dependent methyltransferase [Frondihabitans australicus]|uniref:Methyltransferase family protein n=1 Tax=Frondihabitans australicus TaxID=386892 RepID=A0A495IIZ0_9MICO|nr:class I SAM-dependent methyltransferase [Frondihabitans australicus]RKR75095.1 methyltransferase family protein [Frondihabitans australicus]